MGNACACGKDKESSRPIPDVPSSKPPSPGMSDRGTRGMIPPPQKQDRLAGMDGNVFGEDINESLQIFEAYPFWDIMAVVYVIDLGDCMHPDCQREKALKGKNRPHNFWIEVKCLKSTTVAELTKRIESRLERFASLPDIRHQFSEKGKVRVTALVPRLAPDWVDVARPQQTLGELEEIYGARHSEHTHERADPLWEGHPGIRFYGTTGRPDAEPGGGFEAWEIEEDPDNPFFIQRMANNGIRGNQDGVSSPDHVNSV